MIGGSRARTRRGEDARCELFPIHPDGGISPERIGGLRGFFRPGGVRVPEGPRNASPFAPLPPADVPDPAEIPPPPRRGPSSLRAWSHSRGAELLHRRRPTATPATVVSLQRFGVHRAPVQARRDVQPTDGPVPGLEPSPTNLLSSTSLDHRLLHGPQPDDWIPSRRRPTTWPHRP